MSKQGWPTIYFIELEDGTVRPARDMREWARWIELYGRNSQVGIDYIQGVRVSTVFLGINHNFMGKGPPLLYETMIFGGDLDGEVSRYSTREQARKGHKRWCSKVKATLLGWLG